MKLVNTMLDIFHGLNIVSIMIFFFLLFYQNLVTLSFFSLAHEMKTRKIKFYTKRELKKYIGIKNVTMRK